MAYLKQTWVDQEGQVKYTISDSGDGYKILTPNYEDVYPVGTPVDALHMNHIEDGIEQCYTDFENMIQAIYPVGAIYIGMTETCPLASLFGTWTKITGGLTLQQADSNHAVGTEISAGLPDSTGHVTACVDSTSDAYSPLYVSNKSGDYIDRDESGGKCQVGRLNIRMSRNNSIYGSSNTVQPPALAVNIWQRTA